MYNWNEMVRVARKGLAISRRVEFTAAACDRKQIKANGLSSRSHSPLVSQKHQVVEVKYTTVN
jgi:hypothetical protein